MKTDKNEDFLPENNVPETESRALFPCGCLALFKSFFIVHRTRTLKESFFLKSVKS